jgi:hypothetical protein
METTFEPSLLQNFRTRITLIELIELPILGFAVWVYGASNAITRAGEGLLDQVPFLIGLEIILLGSWAIYNAFIRIGRAGGQRVDIMIWVLASIATASYTFWAWTVLDVNRFLIARLFYRGDAPVEYAWSSRSKQVRKVWEQARKGGYV